ncbi:tRNA guanosine(34) transglycosylase Tgt [Candidatus Marinimicrobia bacterium]|nr:tRNA guanosine(34) transglycosylase Tgt [Candidatus Neomarinimicrobiota bacterium]MDC0383832.1 tRNA guanosine(34) transglycosylase Tgt [Candidatus Neomarinimicrobiota bacterium]
MNFIIETNDVGTSARKGILKTEHGNIKTPIFMPVGTIGAVKTMAPEDLHSVQSQIILGNTYHLYLRPGTKVLNEAGGLHKFNSWDKPILTDSGGFQVFSLARLNKISDDGVEFQSHLDGSRHMFTPEFSMEIQRNIGADIIMAFDECPPGDSEKKIVEKAVERTTKWIERCHRWLNKNQELYNYKQVLFPIVQGSINHRLRKKSIEELIPFSTCGIALGGLAVGEEKNAMLDTIQYCTELLPKDQPRYLMGVGKPSDLLHAIRNGIDMFDCVMPTRNGRNGHIFTSNGVINIKNEKYKHDFSSVDESSFHPWGAKFSKSYVRHLFNINEILGLRIASTLNLAYYLNLMRDAREKISEGSFNTWSNSLLRQMKDMKGM